MDACLPDEIERDGARVLIRDTCQRRTSTKGRGDDATAGNESRENSWTLWEVYKTTQHPNEQEKQKKQKKQIDQMKGEVCPFFLLFFSFFFSPFGLVKHRQY